MKSCGLLGGEANMKGEKLRKKNGRERQKDIEGTEGRGEKRLCSRVGTLREGTEKQNTGKVEPTIMDTEVLGKWY